MSYLEALSGRRHRSTAAQRVCGFLRSVCTGVLIHSALTQRHDWTINHVAASVYSRTYQEDDVKRKIKAERLEFGSFDD